jgi:hypothetical protein
MGTPVCAESVTAAMKPRFEDRLQNLEHGLLNPPVHHIRNTQAAFATSRLWNPYPPDITWLILNPAVGTGNEDLKRL